LNTFPAVQTFRNSNARQNVYCFQSILKKRILRTPCDDLFLSNTSLLLANNLMLGIKH